MSRVSIIIPFYNCSFVDRAIKSALDQTYNNIEVIVVNDGSTKHVNKMKPYLNSVRYIEKENGGTASALNVGIQEATGDYFAWLSSDDLFHKNKVKTQLAFMKKHRASVSYTSFYPIGQNDQITDPPVEVYFKTHQKFKKRMHRGCVVNGCTVMLNMHVFTEVGRFDESLYYTHDYDLWMRVLKNYRFHYLNFPLVYYRTHPDMATKQHKREMKKEIRLIRHKYA